eukprot:jgi/Ulvmu1/8854/UM049_0036.1
MGASSHESGITRRLMFRLVALLGLLTLAISAHAKATPPTTIPTQAGQWPSCCAGSQCTLSIGQTCRGSFLLPHDEARFVLDTSGASACEGGPDKQLVVELWHDLLVNQTANTIDEVQPSPLLFLSRGLSPTVDWSSPSTLPEFFPPLATAATDADGRPTTAAGTFADLTAWRQQRRYHAIHATHNSVEPYSTARAARNVAGLWHIAIANTAGWIDPQRGARVPRFLLRAACYPAPSSVPCPANLVDEQQCSGAGVCLRRPGWPVECRCGQHTAGYLCDTAAQTVALQPDSVDGAVLTSGPVEVQQAPGTWAHYKVALQPGFSQFIAEMERQNGSCLLVVKPEGVGEAPYDVPSRLDLQEFADVQSYINHGRRAARLLQLAPSANPAATPPTIFVSVLSFTDALLAGEDCAARLQLRALPVAAAASSRSLCPFNCSGNGVCQVAATAPGPSQFYDEEYPGELDDPAEMEAHPDRAHLWQLVPAQECMCRSSGRVSMGMWCDGVLREPVLEFGVWTQHVRLPPLHWQPHRVAFAEGDHPLRVELQWGERQDKAWTEQGHTVVVARLGSTAPTVTEHDFLLLSSGGPGGVHEFLISRDDLQDQAELVLAVYNVGLVGATDGPAAALAIAPGASREVHYRVRLTHAVPGSPLSRAAIVGISIGSVAFAFIVLVLCIVICRQCRASMQGPEVELLPIGPRAVPPMSAAAIAELDSFTYDEHGLAAKGVTELQLRHAASAASAVPPADAAAPPLCSVCKDEYRPGERLRQLPCQHIFHLECIDKWLGTWHGTCPVCRMNLLDPHKSARMASRMLASSGRAESANVSARRHLSGGYSGFGYTESMPSASSGVLDGDALRWACGSGHHSAHPGVPGLHAALPRASSASASPDRSPTPVQRVNSGATGPSPRTAWLSPRGPAAWAHDSGPEVMHHDLLRAGGDTDAMAGGTADLSATDSSRVAAYAAAHAFPYDSGGSMAAASRSSSPALGDPPRSGTSAGHAAMPGHPMDHRGFVSDPGRPGPTAYMTAFPTLDDGSVGGGSSDRTMAILGQSTMLPGKSLQPGPSTSGSPLGGPAVGNPALQGGAASASHNSAGREPSQDSLLDSGGGGSSGQLSDDGGSSPVRAHPAVGPAVRLGDGGGGGGEYSSVGGEYSRGLAAAAAGGGASIASTVSPMDTAAAGGGPSIASTITPAQSRDGASASRFPDSGDNFSLPVIGAASWAAPGHSTLSGASLGFPAMHDDEARRRALAAHTPWPGQRQL